MTSPEKVKQPVYVYCYLLRQIRHVAEQRDAALSSLVSEAWALARSELGAFERGEQLDEILNSEPLLESESVENHHGMRDPKQKQVIHFKPAVLQDIQRLADRLDCSLTRLLTAAWILGRARLG